MTADLLLSAIVNFQKRNLIHPDSTATLTTGHPNFTTSHALHNKAYFKTRACFLSILQSSTSTADRVWGAHALSCTPTATSTTRRRASGYAIHPRHKCYSADSHTHLNNVSLCTPSLPKPALLVVTASYWNWSKASSPQQCHMEVPPHCLQVHKHTHFTFTHLDSFSSGKSGAAKS